MSISIRSGLPASASCLTSSKVPALSTSYPPPMRSSVNMRLTAGASSTTRIVGFIALYPSSQARNSCPQIVTLSADYFLAHSGPAGIAARLGNACSGGLFEHGGSAQVTQLLGVIGLHQARNRAGDLLAQGWSADARCAVFHG